MKVSVAICTWNPKPERLAGLAKALQAQTVPMAQWDWMVIDNASNPPISASVFPPSVRLMVESRPGVVSARIRAIRESRSDILVFFDDDNEPEPDYIRQAIDLFERRPDVGVAGARIEGVFERQPSRAHNPYLSWLAVRPWVTKDREVRLRDPWGLLPCGAGMVIRADAAARYADAVEHDQFRLSMDRTQGRLTGSGDTDLALSALDMGYKALLTPRLRLRHVIPAWRLETAYLERLLEDSTYSTALLQRSRGMASRPFLVNWLVRRLRRIVPAHPADWGFRLRMERANDRGERRARSEFACADGRDGK
jgi:glycosyltransferase involved in cell wall biosynthesis